MSNAPIQKGFVTPDGQVFNSMKEANDHLRKPKIKAALATVTSGDGKLSDWLIDNMSDIEGAFESGTIKRVTKVEHNKLAKALEAVAEAHSTVTRSEKEDKKIVSITNVDNKFAFIIDNMDAILDSFRWPSVKRMNDDEKAVAARNSLTALADGDIKVAEWILANKDAILEAYKAGIEKRTVNPKAAEALAAYRAKKAAEKAETAE